MKTIAFYNEKGGVGKSTFNMMFASWLKYKHNVNVGFVDLNSRIIPYRKDEIDEKTNLNVIDKYDLNNIWPIKKPNIQEITELRKVGTTEMPYGYWLGNLLREGEYKDMDVVVIDLPGAVANREFMELTIRDLVSLYAIIIDRDPLTIRASASVVNALAKAKKEGRAVGFINQAQKYNSMKDYEQISSILREAGLRMLPDLISYSERMKKISEVDIMRSTLEYPDWSSNAYKGSRDLGIENLFIDVARVLDQSEDVEGTGRADLPFVSSLKKTFEGQDRRQMRDSSFPEWEFPGPLFPKDRGYTD